VEDSTCDESKLESSTLHANRVSKLDHNFILSKFWAVPNGPSRFTPFIRKNSDGDGNFRRVDYLRNLTTGSAKRTAVTLTGLTAQRFHREIQSEKSMSNFGRRLSLPCLAFRREAKGREARSQT